VDSNFWRNVIVPSSGCRSDVCSEVGGSTWVLTFGLNTLPLFSEYESDNFILRMGMLVAVCHTTRRHVFIVGATRTSDPIRHNHCLIIRRNMGRGEENSLFA
jgi:ribosomal protein L36